MLSAHSQLFRLLLGISLLLPAIAQGQIGDSHLRLFGYFQTSYLHAKDSESDRVQKSFSMQQLNMFLQRDLGSKATAFANFEVLNNFSAGKHWGSFSIEEAWLRWHFNPQLNLRVGLQTPTFNYLNDIKNRTPLLAYVIRPLVYESSFKEIIRIEEYLPGRAYIQAYGYFPKGIAKIDYAIYLGNSPNINSNPEFGQTGVDTTASFLVGSRIGLRAGELGVGVSATYDRYDFPNEINSLIGDDKEKFLQVPRVRIGGDFRYTLRDFSLESEFIRVNYDENDSDLSVDLRFYYATLFYEPTSMLKLFASYWYVKEEQFGFEEEIGINGAYRSYYDVDYFFRAIGGGASLSLSDDIVVKLQAAPVRQETETSKGRWDTDQYYFALGLSVVL